jgi:hypothetical protein
MPGTPHPERIQIGQGDIWVGGTPPAAGTDLTDPTSSTLNAMAAGFTQPVSGGNYVGLTNGEATLTIRPTYYSVESEQSFAEVATVPTAEEATLAAALQEVRSYQNLGIAFAQATTDVNTGVSAAVFLGSKGTLTTQTVALCAPHTLSGVGYMLLTIYRGYSSEGAALNFARRAESRLPITVRAQAVLTRPEGDQLLQLVDYDANPV